MTDYILCALGIIALYYAFRIKTESKNDSKFEDILLFSISFLLRLSFITFGLLCINYSGIISEILN
ncbi:MAG: hypothetical protein IJV31_07050 [Clostridia bacterium]|nr:hypothetical protein [Clostridia bacterium]